MVHNFNDSKKSGKIGESLFVQLAGTGGFFFEDVAQDKNYQKQGIDFILDTGSKKLTFDVKLDFKSSETGNIAFETVSRQKDEVVIKEGWLLTSKADYFIYVIFSGTSIIFAAFTKSSIMSAIEDFGLPEKKVKNFGYESIIIPVPRSKALEYARVFECTIGTKYDELSIHEFFGELITRGNDDSSI